MADMATDELLQQENCCRKELIRGQIAPDEYFMMVLSIYGNGRTFKAFPSMVREISLKHPQFHSQLRQLYETFYSEQSGFLSTERAPSPPKCELDEDLDLELAIELSLKESGAGGSDIYEPEEADLLAYAQWGNGPAEAKPLPLSARLLRRLRCEATTREGGRQGPGSMPTDLDQQGSDPKTKTWGATRLGGYPGDSAPYGLHGPGAVRGPGEGSKPEGARPGGESRRPRWCGRRQHGRGAGRDTDMPETLTCQCLWNEPGVSLHGLW